MTLHLDWVCELRGRDARFFIQRLAERIDRDEPHCVLEVGGGDGYIASLVREAGFEIRSTDPKPREPLRHPVEVMSASRLPFDDGSVDAIISSNVLEHIDDLPQSFDEMCRVLRPGGFMIHSMPRPACSFVSTLIAPMAYVRSWYYLLSGRLFAGKDMARPLPARIPGARRLNRRPRLARFVYKMLYGMWQLQPLRALRIGYGHGVARGPVDELRRWRESQWRERFAHGRLRVVEVCHGDMCFSMNKVFPWRFMKLRGRLASRGWASIAFFIVEMEASSSSVRDHALQSVGAEAAADATARCD